jgi:hypothetical protein
MEDYLQNIMEFERRFVMLPSSQDIFKAVFG